MTTLASGIAEMTLRIIDAEAIDGGTFAGIGIRLAIYAVVLSVLFQMRRGRNWARLALLVVLGGLGTLSLVFEPIVWFVDGHTLGEAFSSGGMVFPAIVLSRVAHILALFAAIPLMFRPAANAYFRDSGRQD